MARSQNGWPVDPARQTITAAGHKAEFRKGNVARLFRALAILYALHVEPLKSLSGYRSAAGNAATGTPVDDSNHRSGTAPDINGSSYPYEYTHRDWWRQHGNPMPAARQALVRKLLKRFPTLRWGTDFPVGWRDPMHYELAPGTTAAQVKANILALGIGWYTVKKGSGISKTRAAAYTGPKVGKITRRPKVGKRVYVVVVDGAWACTKAGDWIKVSKLRKGK